MSLPLLAMLVVFGVSLVVFVVHLSGSSTLCSFLSNEAVLRRFRIDYPGFESRSVILSEDKKTAILLSYDDSEAGLVTSIGAHSLTRLLNAQLIKSLQVNDGQVKLELNDMTLPKVEFEVAPQSTAKTSLMSLQAIAGAKA